MNDERRKQIREALEKLGQAETLLEIARDEEREAHENLPDGLQEAEQGQKIEENAEALEEAVDELEQLAERLEALCS